MVAPRIRIGNEADVPSGDTNIPLGGSLWLRSAIRHPGRYECTIATWRQLRESHSVAGIPAGELLMISKCANPDCNTDFHYLRGGRLYRFDLRQPKQPCNDVPNAICADEPLQASVFFWLCDECSLQYTVHFSTREGISVLPLQQPRCGAVVAHIAEAE